MPHLDNDPPLKASIQAVTRHIAGIKAARHVPGCSIAVVHGDSLVWSEGFGLADYSRGIPASPVTMYKIASLTKLFTATLLLVLRDEGLLCLDDPLSKFVAAVRVKSPALDPQPLTFRQVAAHMGGLPTDVPADSKLKHGSATAQALLTWLRDCELVCPPMTNYLYSNVGYALLGHVLSVVGATPYRKLLRQRVLGPLAMATTTFDVAKIAEERLAVGYRLGQHFEEHLNLRDLERSADYLDAGLYAPAGGLYSSVRDLARFVSLQFHQGPRSLEHPLGGAALREMHSPIAVERDWSGGTAIGWRVGPFGQFTYIGHMGGLPGYSSEIIAIPELQLGVIALTNMDATVGGMCWGALEILVPLFADRRASAIIG